MTALLGELSLAVAMVAAFSLASSLFLPAKGRLRKDVLLSFSINVVFASLATAFGALLYAFAVSDFSILLVATNSHTAKPFIYKLSGTWGNHEGSMLLYIFFVSLVTQLFRFINLSNTSEFCYRVLGVQGVVLFLLLVYLIFASNPFVTVPQVPIQGLGLNPLLQDIGLALHPPMLYLGYVGFTIAFSFAVAGILEGNVDKAWAAALRPWVVVTLSFLTIGIALGSWWAYRELGWGGFWFWDPVENCSLLPWLSGVALLHSLLVLEKRNALASWSVLLSILTYALGLIGFFLVRSGILTSVHSFATDPQRGIFILSLITVLVGGALLLFGIKGARLHRNASISGVCRENFLLINNLLLLVLCFTVALGTLYPIFLELFTGARISVGAPYFNTVFNSLALVVVVLAIFAPALAWKKGSMEDALQRYTYSTLFAFSFLLTLIVKEKAFNLAILGATTGIWLIAAMLESLVRRVHFFEPPFKKALLQLKHLPRSYYAQLLGHLGLGIIVLGISFASGWYIEKEQMMRPGQEMELSRFKVAFHGTGLEFGKNYISEKGAYHLLQGNSQQNGFITTLSPERRLYPVENQKTTESSIYHGVRGDVYVVLGDPDEKGGYLTRAYYRPWMWFLWCGAAVIALGLALAAGFRHAIIRSGGKNKAQSHTPAKGLKGVRGFLKIAYFTPFIAFMLLMAGFMGGLLRATEAPAGWYTDTFPLIGDEVPSFTLKSLDGGERFTDELLKKDRYTLVNVFASWCTSCAVEHELLMDLKNRDVVKIYAINWRDAESDAKKWLERHGNPYEKVGVDSFGDVAINFGITGAPETFLVGPKGKIVFRHAGPLTREILETEILPKIRSRERE